MKNHQAYQLLSSPRRTQKPSAAQPKPAGNCDIESAQEDQRNKMIVLQLYQALENRDARLVKELLATDLEWRFHGPRSHQHMKRILTGEDASFHFCLHSVHAFGLTVIAEGTDSAGLLFWVHAWTFSDGLITQVREYFNTNVTVTRVDSEAEWPTFVWQSSFSGSTEKSLPGLVLAL